MKSTIWKVIGLVAIISIGLGAIYFAVFNRGSESDTPTIAQSELKRDVPAAENVIEEEKSESRPAPSGPQPRIQFEETVYDWGTVYQNTKVTHIFMFKNVGQADLNISEVKSG